MIEKKIDTNKPFIAIRNDLEGDDYTATMGEYFCNPLAEDLLEVSASTGGFFSAEGVGVLESSPSAEPTFSVPSGGAVRFALSTWDEYQEMVIHWQVRYKTASGAKYVAEFGTFKRLEDATHHENVPCLDSSAWLVPGETSEIVPAP